MVDIKQVVDIESAKALKYDGQDLTLQEKQVLEDENLKEVDGVTADLPKLRKAVELLEVIIKAKKADSFDDKLYAKLNGARSETDVVKALNKNGLYQSAIDYLISKRGGNKDEGKDEESINKLLDDRNTKISVLEARIKKIELMEDKAANNQALLEEKVTKKEQQIEKLEDLKNLMEQKTLAAGRPLNLAGVVLNEYVDIHGVTRNGVHPNKLLEEIVDTAVACSDRKKKHFNTNIRSYFGRNWISKDSLQTLMLQVWEVFLEIGKTDFFAKATLSSGDKRKLEGYWDDLAKIEWGWAENPGYYARFQWKKDKTLRSSEVSKRSDDIWPTKTFDFEKLREMVELCLGPNATVSSDFKALFGEKERTWKWFGFSEEPFKKSSWTGGYEIKKWLEKDHPNLAHEIEMNVKKTDGSSGHVKFIADVFTNEATGKVFTKADFANEKGDFEHIAENTLRELNYVKAIRKAGVDESIISDEEILSITMLSRDVIWKRRKKQKVSYSPAGIREVKTVTHLLTDKKATGLAVTKVNENCSDKTSAEYRIDTSPLAIKISRENAALRVLRGRANIASSGGVKFYEDKLNLELQKAELEQEIIELEAEKNKLKRQDPSTIKEEFKALFGEDLNASIVGKFTRAEIIRLQMKLNAIKAKESPMEKWFLDAEGKLDDLRSSLKEHEAKINFWERSADTLNERLDNCPDKVELEKYRKAYEEAGKLIKLLKNEENEQEALRKRIAGETSPTVPPQEIPEISDTELRTYFGEIDGVVDQALADKWKNAKVKKNKIKGIIEEVTEVSDRKKATKEFIDHLKGKGLDNGDKLNEKDDAEKIWKEFLSKEPERVVKTIYTCRLEKDDFKNATKNKMKEQVKNKDTDNEEKLTMTEYGATEKDGDPDDKGMLKYLWEEAIGDPHKFSKTKDTSTPTTPQDENEKSGILKHLGDNWYWYVGAVVLLIILLGVVFWKQISEWWNGPAEEEGQGKTEEGEEETEESK